MFGYIDVNYLGHILPQYGRFLLKHPVYCFWTVNRIRIQQPLESKSLKNHRCCKSLL